MTGILIKKQLTEVFRNIFYDSKRGRVRSKGAAVAGLIGYLALVVGLFGIMFTVLGRSLCFPLVAVGQDWLYFDIFILLSILLGVFGSVFSTYAEVYLAKDNDLLLSLPIPVGSILGARIFVVYLMGLLYCGSGMGAGIIVYLTTVPFTAAALFGCLLLFFLVSLLVLIFSCLLGFVVAKLSTKLKRRGVVAALIGIGCFAIYYVIYSRASYLINDMIRNAAEYGGELKSDWYPLYFIGMTGEGDPISMLICTAVVVGAFLLLWQVLKRTYIGIVTTKGKEEHREYKEKTVRVRPVLGALTAKERARFLSSPTYMLNAGLGIILLPVAGIFLLARGGGFVASLEAMGGKGAGEVVICAIICLIGSMNMISTPSVSLEGKQLWILRSLPVSAEDILRAKVQNHLLFTEIPMLICLLLVFPLFSGSFVSRILMLAACFLNAYLMGYWGLFLGIKNVNLSWTNENAPIKQSISIFLTMMSGFLLAALIGGLYFLFGRMTGADVYLAFVSVIEFVLVNLLKRWTATQGAKILNNL